MHDLSARFDCQVGLSDHTLGIGVALTSIGLGARVIEKHFTLSRAEGGVDAAFSLEPQEMKQLVAESKSSYDAMGEIKYGPSGPKEMKSLQEPTIYLFCKRLRNWFCRYAERRCRIRPGLWFRTSI